MSKVYVIGAEGSALKEAAEAKNHVVLDLSKVQYVDSAFLGEVMVLWKVQEEAERKLVVRGVSAHVRSLLHFYMAEWLLVQ